MESPHRSQPSLQPSEFCTLVLEHAPATAGIRRSELIVAHDGPSSPLRIRIVGRGVYSDHPAVAVEPARLDFGSQPLDRRSEISTVRFINEGRGRLQIRAIRIAGADAAQFQIVAGTCEGSTFIAPESECTFGVRYLAASSGEHRAVVRIEHSTAAEPEEMPLSGSASNE